MADVPARSTVLQISVAELCFPEKVFGCQISLGFLGHICSICFILFPRLIRSDAWGMMKATWIFLNNTVWCLYLIPTLLATGYEFGINNHVYSGADSCSTPCIMHPTCISSSLAHLPNLNTSPNPMTRGFFWTPFCRVTHDFSSIAGLYNIVYTVRAYLGRICSWKLRIQVQVGQSLRARAQSPTLVHVTSCNICNKPGSLHLASTHRTIIRPSVRT